MAVTPSAGTRKDLTSESLATEPRRTVRALAERTTMHGCQNIIETEYHVARRIMWSVLLLATAGLFLNAFIRGIARYRSYPSSISVDIEPNKNLTLPDVTICNYYLYGRKSFLESQSADIQDLLTGYASQVASDDTPSFASFLRQGMDSVEQFMSYCLMDLKFFNCTEAASIIMSWTDACYSLSLADYVQRTNRAFEGLKFGILVDESEYGDVYISPGMGIRIMLHEHGEMPDENLAVHIEPGTDVHIAVRKSRNVRLGTPYSTDDCREEQDWDSPLSSVYTKQGCERDCFMTFFRRHVGCSFSGEMNDTRACSLYEVIAYNRDAMGFVDGPQCECLRPCKETIFSTDVTTLTHRDRTPGDRKKISVNIFYSTFDVTVVTQSASYDFDAFIADVGGQMGLFLGASILTWSEILEFALVYVAKMLVKYK